MAGIEDVLACYPVMDSLVRQLPIGDLISLSRCSFKCRCRTHGLAGEPSDADYISGTNVRKALSLGATDTPLWRALKRRSLQLCSEKTHTKGGQPSGCRMCSKPVCAACVVKSSFNKPGNTFGKRKRAFCGDCWSTGQPYAECLQFSGSARLRLDYPNRQVCRCTATDGILCSSCKELTLLDPPDRMLKCSGVGCGKVLCESTTAGRICLWCTLALPGQRSKDSLRVEYEFRYPTSGMKQDDHQYGESNMRLPTYSVFDDDHASSSADISTSPTSWLPSPNLAPPIVDRPPGYTSLDEQRYDADAARHRRERRNSIGSTKAESESEHSETTLIDNETAEGTVDGDIDSNDGKKGKKP